MSKYIKLEDAIGCECPFMEIYEDCINCPLYNGGSEVCEMGKWLKSLPTIEVSEDCISREWVKGICEAMLDEEMLGHMLGHIEDAPSVVPSCQKNRKVERAEGEWIVKQSGFAECSVCEQHYFSDYNYCPNCGAKMKGQRNDTRNQDTERIRTSGISRRKNL